jgi:hypothetical protein
MAQVAFYPELDDFRMKWVEPINATIIQGRIRTEAPGFDADFKKHKEALFEQILLFDSVKLNVIGPNVVAPLLYDSMGSKPFEALLEQEAISFVVWEPHLIMGYNGDGLANTFAGRFGDGEKTVDIEKIVDRGLSMQPTKMTDAKTRMLRKKILERHSLLDPVLPDSAWKIAHKALAEGSLQHVGLEPRESPVGLPLHSGQALLRSAEALLKCRYVLTEGIISSGDEAIFDLFTIGVNNLRTKNKTFENFSTIAEYEKFPNLRALFGSVEAPFDRAAKFRSTHTAQEFRRWLSTLDGSSSTIDIIREYTYALTKRKGLFESNTAKILKAVSIVALTRAVAHASSDFDGLLAGIMGGASLTSVSSILDLSSELGLGIVDSLILDTLKVGWTPRAFFNGLRRNMPQVKI